MEILETKKIRVVREKAQAPRQGHPAGQQDYPNYPALT
jgi:hypothetical protein